MGSTVYDHCRNCIHWDSNKQDEDRKAKCNYHGGTSHIRGWCGRHDVKNPADGNDPSVISGCVITAQLAGGITEGTDTTLLGILRTIGYEGPEDYYEPLRTYDKDYPKAGE